jgi:phosphoribosylaminoimidazole-succinocarboxamide synthase
MSNLTPTTKFEKHDRPLTPAEAVNEGLVDKNTWQQLQKISLELFKFGQTTATAKGLILVDTKYEFGLDHDNNIILIDEIHTPDSSRYWRTDIYQSQIDQGQEPDNYDKEFLRLWFKSRFDPYKDKQAPKPSAAIIQVLTDRYVYVYEHLTGKKFVPDKSDDPVQRIENNLLAVLGKAK